MTDERWRHIPDFEEYAVSTHGRVIHIRFDRYLTDQRCADDTRKVTLYLDGVAYQKYVHQCVAAAFLDGFVWGRPVKHLDGDNANNHISNLRGL